MNSKRIYDIKQKGKKARGKSELIEHLEGGRLTLRQAVQAHCYDCMGYFADEKADCKIPTCSLHPFMAYNKSKIKRKSRRVLTAEHKEKMQAARQM